jgi:putative serine protease PepD
MSVQTLERPPELPPPPDPAPPATAGSGGGGGGRITVDLSGGRTVAATVVGTDQATDLAVLQAEGVSGLEAATFSDSDTLAVGDTVLAVGNSLGLEGSVTAGIVSALHRTLDTDGSVDGQSSGSIGVGFAIPGNRVQQVVNQLTGGVQTVSASTPG